MKCRGKPDTTWNIPCIMFSPLHSMLYPGKLITFGTVYLAFKYCWWGGGSHSYRVHAPPPPPGGGEGGDLGWIVDLAGISRGEDNVQALAWGPMHCKKGGRPGFALARPQALTGPPAALLGYTVPKVIDFPRYYRKWSRENKILSGIFRVVSRFPIHFVLYLGNLYYFLTVYG